MRLLLCGLVLCLFVCLVQSHTGDHVHPGTWSFPAINFQTTCSASVRTKFNNAVGLLHLFWYDEAREIFTAINTEQPTCLMACWGVAMTYWAPLWWLPSTTDELGAIQAIGMAKNSSSWNNLTTREKAYIEAIEVIFSNLAITTYADRVSLFEDKMYSLYIQYGREDPEASVFYALSVIAKGLVVGNRGETKYSENRRAGNILELVRFDNPAHNGALHYLLHAYDNPALAPLALDAVNYYDNNWVNKTQARSMNLRIWTRLGIWEKVIEQGFALMQYWRGNEDVAWYPPSWVDASTYWAYANSQRANDADVKRHVELLLKVNVTNPDIYAGFNIFSTIIRYHYELGLWKEMSTLQVPSTLSNSPREKIMMHFARIVGHSHYKRDRLGIREAVEAMITINETIATKDPSYNRWTKKRQSEINALILAGRAWSLYSDGAADEAIDILGSVDAHYHYWGVPSLTIIIPAEAIGDVLLRAGRFEDAITKYTYALSEYPNEFQTIYGLGQGYAGVADDFNTTLWYTKLTRQCGATKCESRLYMKAVHSALRALVQQTRIDSWGLFLLLAGGAFISVSAAGAIALHYRENEWWTDFNH